MDILVQSGLIVYINEEKKFKMTQKGTQALAAFTKMDELLVPKAAHKKIEISENFVPFP